MQNGIPNNIIILLELDVTSLFIYAIVVAYRVGCVRITVVDLEAWYAVSSTRVLPSLLLHIVGQRPAVLAAGAGRVSCIFYIFHLSSISNVLCFGRRLT